MREKDIEKKGFSADRTRASSASSNADVEERGSDRLVAYAETPPSLLDTLAQGVVYQAADGRITSANAAARAILGVPLEEMKGRQPTDRRWRTIAEDGTELSGNDHPTMVALRTGSAVRDVVMGILNPRYGERRWVNVSAVPEFRPGESRPYQVYTTLEDITDYRRMAHALQERNQQLELLNRAGQVFNSTLDLSTILATVLEEVRSLVEVTICSVWLMDPDSNDLVCHQGSDPGKEIVRGWHLQLGVGIAGWAAQNHQSVIIPDAQADERHYRELDRLTGLVSRSMLAVPLLVREDLIGVLEVIDERPNRFDDSHLTLLGLVAASAATAIDNAHLLQTQREQLELAEALATAAAVVNSSLEIDEVLDRILEQVERVVSGDTFNIMLVEGPRARIVRSRGYEQLGVADLMPSEPTPIDAYPSLHSMVTTGGSVLISDTLSSPDWVPLQGREWRRSYIGSPISVGNQVVGFLNVNGTRPGQFGPADVQRLSSFANYTATAIENAQLFEQTQQEIIERMQAEMALRESEERFRRLSDASEEGVAIHDRGIVADANGALATMFGYEFTEVIATRLERYLTPESWKTVSPYLSNGFEGPREVVGVRKDGSTFPCEIAAKPYQYRARTLHVAIFRDITERKRNEEELRRRATQQEALNAIIGAAAAAPDLADLLDIVLSHTLRATDLEMGAIWTGGQYATRGVHSEIGMTLAQAAQTAGTDGASSHIVPDWAVSDDGALDAMRQAMARSEIRASLTVPILVEGRRTGGLCLAATCPRSWSTEEIALAEAIGKQVGAAAERLRLVGEIRHQAQRMQLIVDTVPEGVLLLNGAGKVVLANPAGKEGLASLASASVGDTLQQLGDRPLAELLEPPPDGLWHRVEAASTAPRSFEMVARPIDATPENQSWVMVLRDVTQERQLEQQTRRQERLAAVGQLAAGIAHDFRNIMAVITLYTQMLILRPDLPAEVLRRLRLVEDQAKRAGDLIQQILDFSRRSVFERTPIDLVSLLREQVELLGRTLPESIEISLVSPPCVNGAGNQNEYTVFADPTRIQQVIMNLALNARDAMPTGGQLRIELGRLRIERAQDAPLPGMEAGAENWVTISVSDNGVGVPPDALPHIFEPFFTTKAAGGGTGLGLAQVYGIIKQHEGHIDVTSEWGRGTTLTIYLPALSVAPPLPGGPAAESLCRGDGETILVVEDNTSTRAALVESLEQLNYKVVEAESGEAALTMCSANRRISLVLSDLVMPGLGGTALMQALRQQNPTLPLVVLTGHPRGDAAKELEEIGVADWLQKPPSLEDLSDVLRRALNGC